jgi:hypothetical protein
MKIGMVNTEGRWYMIRVYAKETETVERLLNEGWEPFAAQWLPDDDELIWMKRYE